MKNFSKVIATLCIITMLFTLFTACSQDSKTDKSESEQQTLKQATTGKETQKETEPPKPVTLRFSWWGAESRHKVTLDAMDLYMKQNTHVTVEGEYSGWDGYYEKFLTQVAGGTAADMYPLSMNWIYELIQRKGAFYDLYKYEGVDISGFETKFLEANCVREGMLLGLPMGINVSSIMFNKSFFEKNGIPFDTEWDWDKILEVGKKIHDNDKESYLINAEEGILVSHIMTRYITEKAGNYWVKNDFTIGADKNIIVDAFAYIKKLFDYGIVQPYAELALFKGKETENPKWINEQAGMSISLISVYGRTAKSIQAEVDVARAPIGKDAKTSAIIVRPATILSVNGKSKNLEETATFVNWFINDKDAALILGTARSAPASKYARDALIDANKIEAPVVKAIDLALANPGLPDGDLENNSELIQILVDQIQMVAFNKATPEQAAEELINQLTDKLKDLKARSN